MCVLAATALLCAFCPEAHGAPPEEQFKQELAKCEAIPPKKYRTGMLFNPDGYRTYYERSRCIQKVAIEYREIDLCEQVKKRWSLFFSGFAYSEKACREGVQERLARDQAAADAIKTWEIFRLEAISFERQYNNDFIAKIQTEGVHTGEYNFIIELSMDGSSKTVVLQDFNRSLTPDGNILFHHIRSEQIRNALGSQSLDYDLRVKIALTLVPRTHNDHFILDLIPVKERSSHLEVDVNFARL